MRGRLSQLVDLLLQGGCLLEQNRKMHAFLQEHNILMDYIETPGGHDWKFWHPASIGVAELRWKHLNE